MIEPISSPKVLRSGSYQQIILSANGAFSPLLKEIYYGYRTQRLDVVAYERERITVPQRIALPKGTLLKIRPEKIPDELGQKTPDSVDDWAQRRFWESIRGLGTGDVGSGGKAQDHQFIVKARLLLLANNKKVYLPDDLKVIEISDLLEGRIDIEDYGKRLPRKSVNQLEVGDLIVLRTLGAGDFLYILANSLLEADGKGKLRQEALDWKPVLNQALEEHGSEMIYNLLKNKGHILANHSYVWIWTTEIVINPMPESRFRDLIIILDDLGYKVQDNDPVTVAGERWMKMQEIKRYHRRAGQTIRQALLTELRKIIKSGEVITDSYSLTLPDVSAGELSVFRISGVDPKTIDVIYHHTGVITDME
jgi:hypothetical protein